MKIFIVCGSVGFNTDSPTRWIAYAYMDEENAKNRIEELKSLLIELEVEKVDYHSAKQREAFKSKVRKHDRGDPLFEFDYAGEVTYIIKMMDIVDFDTAANKLGTDPNK